MAKMYIFIPSCKRFNFIWGCIFSLSILNGFLYLIWWYALWVQYALQALPMNLWENLKGPLYFHIYDHFWYFTVFLSKIYFIVERKQERTSRFYCLWNTCYPAIKFNYKYSQHSIGFLDTNKEQRAK